MAVRVRLGADRYDFRLVGGRIRHRCSLKNDIQIPARSANMFYCHDRETLAVNKEQCVVTDCIDDARYAP
jgi:hypothetical protein